MAKEHTMILDLNIADIQAAKSKAELGTFIRKSIHASVTLDLIAPGSADKAGFTQIVYILALAFVHVFETKYDASLEVMKTCLINKLEEVKRELL